MAQAYGVSREAMLRRFAETHSAAVAAVFLSWKLKPTQHRTIGLQDQGHLFGDATELARHAKKLRVDYSIPSEEFATAGYFVPNDKSVASGEGPIFAAASSGMPSDDVCHLDLGSIIGRFKVFALPVWTADSDVGPNGENAVAAIVEPFELETRLRKVEARRGWFD